MYSFTFGVCAMATEPVFLAGRQLSNRVPKPMGLMDILGSPL